jgi:hypothetical protein
MSEQISQQDDMLLPAAQVRRRYSCSDSFCGVSAQVAKAATGAAKVALDILREAIAKDGEIPPASNYIAGHVRVLRDSLWRSLFYARAIEQGDTPEARKKAFQRASQRLQAIGLIGFHGGLVWLT